ncbi:10 kda heat shock protein, partial [Phytophthora pseudosyringae]
MGPGSPVRKVGWEEHRDVETTHLSSPTNAILHNSSHVLPPSNVRGPMLVKPVATPALPTLLTKIQPGEGSMRTENVESRRSSTLKRLSSSISTTLLPSHPSRSIYLQFLFAGVVTICLLWTVLLIMLNTAPNYTVNRVMATEDFDNGVFWLFVDPSPYLLWLTVLGLSVAGGGYVAILIKMVVRPKRRVSQAPRPSPKIDATKRQSERKLGMKIGDLAFETVLLFQVLEAGSPKPIVAIFTFIIASNALACAATMFLQSKRIGLVETLVDLL